VGLLTLRLSQWELPTGERIRRGGGSTARPLWCHLLLRRKNRLGGAICTIDACFGLLLTKSNPFDGVKPHAPVQIHCEEATEKNRQNSFQFWSTSSQAKRQNMDSTRK